MPKKRTEPAAAGAFPDDAARAAIRADLGTTMLVEAAAGTGKTTSLVERMVALAATGTTTVDHLSAVTFTIRAAAQLRQRFQNALESALREEKDTARRGRLSAALSRLDSCFVGTIHAFGARLLRERPVEAGVDPGFQEMDDPEDGAARREAWDRFTESLFLSADPRLARLIELGIALEDLRNNFSAVCENSDVDVAIGARRLEPDFTGVRRQVEAFLDRAEQAVPAEVPPGGWNGFQEAVRRAQRLRELLDADRAADFVRILKVLKPGGAKEGAVGSWRKSFDLLREDVIKPALAAWGEYVYPDVMALLVDARDRYAQWRRREGRLNFQDLLIHARNLLRDHPDVRTALRERFTPVLVDEFQDTDPIQAEILFYLTGSDAEEKDWRKLVPLAGSLFVVGDPKQSIYRFRRADIETYAGVRSRIQASGRLLELSTNFRSTSALCEWVNRAFPRPGFFPKEATPGQAGYVPISAARQDGALSPCALRLPTPASGNSERPVAEADASRIAEVIASAIAKGEKRPEDFLILFRRRKFMADYARALEERGVVPEIGGGAAFGASEELEALMPVLESLADSDNPVPFVAALRGPFFGVDDETLYRFVRAGGRFSFRAALPEAADAGIRRAFELFREGERLVETLPPAAAISRLVERLGGTALAAARDLGDSRAGNLLKALSAARKFSSDGLDFFAVVEELERLREEDSVEQMSVEPGRPGAVRLMTLHSAKGLEAPVVFLAEPAAGSGRPRNYCIDRSVEPPRGYFRVTKRFGEHGEEEIARPAGWEKMQESEKSFDEAEKVRMLYVGATRARDLLVVSIKKTAAGRAAGAWAALDPFLEENLASRAPAPARQPAGPPLRPAEDIEAFRGRRLDRRERCASPSYAVTSVTAVAHSGADRPFRERTGRGMSWGSVIHRLLEALMRDGSLELRPYAANVLAEEGREPEDLEKAIELVESVRSSALWKRALTARRRMVEVPFALKVPSASVEEKSGPSETLLTGALDLVFEEDGVWTIVDYKSDTVTNNLEELVAFYRPQIDHYRRYWRQLTGQPTRAGLFFVATGQEAWLEES
jgi:ATP-dependent helicase/nuclease subunit A